MKPYLAVIFSKTNDQYAEMLSHLSLKTPVDILRVDDSEQASAFDIYIDAADLLATLKQVRLDYSTILFDHGQMSNDSMGVVSEWMASVEQPFTLIDLGENLVSICFSEVLDLHRHLYIYEGLNVNCDQKEMTFHDLGLDDIEELTQQVLLEGRDQLSDLLNSKSPLLYTGAANESLLRFELFTNHKDDPKVNGEVLLEGQQAELGHGHAVYSFAKPKRLLLLWANQQANEGQLKYELKKLLKQSKSKVSEIKSARVSVESESVEEILSFLDSIPLDNEIDVTFNQDTIAAAIESQSNDNDWEIIAERSSDNSRLVLVNTGC